MLAAPFQEQTISSGSITVTTSTLTTRASKGSALTHAELDANFTAVQHYNVGLQPETGTSDTLTTISGLDDGEMVVLHTVDSGDTITVSHAGGVIELNGNVDATLASPDEVLTLIQVGSVLYEHSRGFLTAGLSSHAATHQDGGADEVAVTGGMMNADFGDFACDGTATGCSLENDTVTPNDVLSTGQVDGQALAYKSAGATWQWVAVGGGSVTLDQAFDNGRTIDGATSTGTAVLIGGATADRQLSIYSPATNDVRIDPPSGADRTLRVPTNQNLLVYDDELGANMLVVDGDAAQESMWLWQTTYKPIEVRTEFIPIGACNDDTTPPAAIAARSQTDYRDFDSGTTESVLCDWDVPEDLYEATSDEVKVQAVFIITQGSPNEPATNEGVSWSIAGCSIATGESLDCTEGTDNNSELADLGGHTQWDVVVAPYVAIAITSLDRGEVVRLQVQRDVADTQDDYLQDVGLRGIRIKYYREVQGVSY